MSMDFGGFDVQKSELMPEELLYDLFLSINPHENRNLRDAEKAHAREDFEAFCRLMVPGYLDGEHLEEVRFVLSEVAAGRIKRLIMTIPPRHSKSLHVSENFPAWYLGNNPDHRVIAASHTAHLAYTFSRRVRNKFGEYHWPFPHVKLADDKQGVSAWDIEGSLTGGYAAVGVGGSPAGLGGDLIIIDDPIRNQQDADSPTIREAIWEWFNGTIYTRRQPGAAIIVTATRWHKDDLTGRLLKRQQEGGEEWYHLHLPAIRPDGSPLWPEFWDDDEYKLAQNNADRVWNAQYMGTPTTEGGNLIKEEWFPYAPYGERYLGIVQAWDCASKPGVSNDYSVCTTLGITMNSFDILHMWRDQVAFPDLVTAARDRATWVSMAYPNLPFTLAIEDADAGVQLIQTLAAKSRLPLHPVPATGTNLKVQRVIGNTPIMKSRRVRILEGQPWIKEMMTEFTDFPNGEHDDIVDSAMIAVSIASGGPGANIVESRSYLKERNQDDDPSNFSGRRKPPPPRKGNR